MMRRVWLAALAVSAIAAAALVQGQATAQSQGAPPSSASPESSTPISPADAAKAKRAALRSCKLKCDHLYPVTLRIIGEGTTMEKPEITGNVAANEMCKRGCDTGTPAS